LKSPKSSSLSSSTTDVIDDADAIDVADARFLIGIVA
jgi:hypothetical protein